MDKMKNPGEIIREAGSKKIDRDPIESKRIAIEVMVSETAELIKHNPDIKREQALASLLNRIRKVADKDADFIRKTIDNMPVPVGEKYLQGLISEIRKGMN